MAVKKKKIKVFVIDTNVFIHKPDCVMSFRDNEIVIPIWVLEELDKLKSHNDEKGRNARAAIRFLDSVGRRGDLQKGVRIANGSILRVVLHYSKKFPYSFSQEKADNKIILTAYLLQQEGRFVFFVSKDINARVKARALGLKVADYEKQKVDFDKLYQGLVIRQATAETIQNFQKEEEIDCEEDAPPNQFFLFQEQNSRLRSYGRYFPNERKIKRPQFLLPTICGVSPLNDKQQMAVELLLDPSLSLVSLIGVAGTGKTLLAIAAGLHLVLENKQYARVLVSRPVIPMGKDIGYLPGKKGEKLSHWMQPLFDNLEYIISVYKKQNMKTIDQLLGNNSIEVEALTYMRGRSLANQYIIIDEAQNLTPHEIKTIVSRAGHDTKIVLTGDPYQIDSPYLDSNSNGLSYLIESFKGQQMFGHISLDKTERSPLAELATELL